MDFEVITTDEDRECIKDKGYMNVIRVRFELEGKTYTHLNYYNTSSGFAYFITEGVMWEEEYETEDEDEEEVVEEQVVEEKIKKKVKLIIVD